MNKFIAILISQSVFLLLLIRLIESYKVVESIEPPGSNNTQTRFEYSGIETFDSRTKGQFVSDFGVTVPPLLGGKYTGVGTIAGAGLGGGANGKGKFLAAGTLINLLITLNGSKGVNYFGLLICQLRRIDTIEFFADSPNEEKIHSWNATLISNYLNSKKSETEYAKYFRNPWFDNQGLDQPFVFVNFYFFNIKIKRITISASTFSDNHIIGWFNNMSGERVQPYKPPSSTSTSSTSSTSPNSSFLSTPSTSSALTVSTTKQNCTNSTHKNRSGFAVFLNFWIH